MNKKEAIREKLLAQFKAQFRLRMSTKGFFSATLTIRLSICRTTMRRWQCSKQKKKAVNKRKRPSWLLLPKSNKSSNQPLLQQSLDLARASKIDAPLLLHFRCLIYSLRLCCQLQWPGNRRPSRRRSRLRRPPPRRRDEGHHQR